MTLQQGLAFALVGGAIVVVTLIAHSWWRLSATLKAVRDSRNV